MDVSEIEGLLLDDSTKGMPGGVPPFPLGRIADQGWNVLNEDLPLPLLVLKRDALEHNIEVMRRYCERQGVLLAPHGKTTMAPQIFKMQLDAGAWGITAASIEHLQVYRRFGVSRVLLANQVVGRPNLQYLCEELRKDPEFDFYCFVDSPRGVEVLDEAARQSKLTRPIQVLAEIGYMGGRAGVRSKEELDALSSAIQDSRGVELRGVSGFEGLLPVARFAAPDDVSEEDELEPFLLSLGEAVAHLRSKKALPDDFIVTAGGSAAFDRVVDILGDAGGRLILRSGCYVTHDHGMYAGTSPLHDSATQMTRELGSLQQALELWSYVQSSPEKDLSLLTFGRRDAPFDYGLPVPLRHLRARKSAPATVDGWEITSLNDQHGYLRHPANAPIAVGDRIVCGISHPCTAFDKWSVIPVVDDKYNVVEAIKTYF
jgi:D-serine dehydratase